MDSLTEEDKSSEAENDSGMGTDDNQKYCKDENDNLSKTTDVDAVKPADDLSMVYVILCIREHFSIGSYRCQSLVQ